MLYSLNKVIILEEPVWESQKKVELEIKKWAFLHSIGKKELQWFDLRQADLFGQRQRYRESIMMILVCYANILSA